MAAVKTAAKTGTAPAAAAAAAAMTPQEMAKALAAGTEAETAAAAAAAPGRPRRTAEELLAERRQRRQEAGIETPGADPEGSGAGGSGLDAIPTQPVSAAKMDNRPEFVRIGTLALRLKALPTKRMIALEDSVWKHWPAVIFYAAIGDLYGRGVDTAKTADFWSGVLLAEALQGAAAAEDPEAAKAELLARPPLKTAQEIPFDLAQLQQLFVSEAREAAAADAEAASLPEPRTVDRMCEAVWMLAEGTPGLTREALPDLLEEHLTLPQYADLLRALFLTVGDFPGDLADRFI